MDRKAVILDSEGNIIGEAMLVQMGVETTVLKTENFRFQDIPPCSIRFCLFLKYVEMYEGTVFDVKDDLVYIKDLRDNADKARKDVKLNVSFDSIISCFKAGCEPKNWPVRMKDISSGGICFICKEELNKDDIYETVIPITKFPLVLQFKIVRALKEEGTVGWIYGCSFVGMCEKEEKMLREVVYRLIGLKYKNKIQRRNVH